MTSLLMLSMVVNSCSAPASNPPLPAGAELQVRLETLVSSRHSQPGDPVRAVTIAPVPAPGKPLLRAGLPVSGRIAAARRSGLTLPAELTLVFDRIGDAKAWSAVIRAVPASVDNARESVRPDGTIVGLSPVHVRPNSVETLLMLAAHAHPYALLGIEAFRLLRREAEGGDIDYPPGVEMTLRLERSLETAGAPAWQPPPAPAGLSSRDLEELAARQPLRTAAGAGRHPSDLTNLLFAGPRPVLEKAFAAAGWSDAVRTTATTAARTFFAAAAHHSYKEAPVSTLLLDGRKPDFVFEKQNDTFSKRHHIRVWETADDATRGPIWVAAATHDIGIVFSPETRTFTHKVESQIDKERSKITNDLIFTGMVSAAALVDRPQAPRQLRNATGDDLETDGRMQFIVLANGGGRD